MCGDMFSKSVLLRLCLQFSCPAMLKRGSLSERTKTEFYIAMSAVFERFHWIVSTGRGDMHSYGLSFPLLYWNCNKEAKVSTGTNKVTVLKSK